MVQTVVKGNKSEWHVLIELAFNNQSVEQDVYEALDDLYNKNIIFEVVIGDTA